MQLQKNQACQDIKVSIFKNDTLIKPPFKGLINHENCCYINSCLQILLNCNIFNHENEPKNELSQYLYYLKSIYQKSQVNVDVKDFRDVLNKYSNQKYEPNIIYDAISVLTNIISLLDEPLKNKFLGIDKSHDQLFYIVIPLQELQNKKELDKALFLNQMIIYPEKLIVEVTRGKQDGLKCHDPVYYNQFFKWDDNNYRLLCVLNHKGFQKDGHYTLKIRSRKGFYLVDEQIIFKKDLETRSRAIILILYEKVQ